MDDRLLKLEQRLGDLFGNNQCLCQVHDWSKIVALAWALRQADLDPAAVAARVQDPRLFGRFQITEGATGLIGGHDHVCLEKPIQMIMSAATESLA